MLQLDVLAEQRRVVEEEHGVLHTLPVLEEDEGEGLLSARLLVPGHRGVVLEVRVNNKTL